MNIQELPAEKLLKAMRLREEQEQEDFQKQFELEQAARWSCIDEIRRRTGLAYLEQLGWPCEETSVYKNRYTGNEEQLLEMYEERYNSEIDLSFKEWLDYQSPFLSESWLPKEEWTSDECFKEYLPKNTLMGWV